MHMGAPGSTDDKPGCTWEHLGEPATSLGVPTSSLGALVTSLGAPRIAVEQSGKYNICCGNAAGVPGNHSYYISFNDFKTHVFGMYSYLCMYIASHLHMVDVDGLQAVLESNSRCAWK